MHKKILGLLLCSLLTVTSGCKKRETTESVTRRSETRDVCGLITKEEIEAVQGSPVKETKSSSTPGGEFQVSQCFYTAAEFSRSVSLALTESNPGSGAKRRVKDFWKETFGRYAGEQKESESDKEKKESLREQARARGEEQESNPPKKIEGIGEAAYWTRSRVGGALYVLKKDSMIRISVGGPDPEEKKLENSKALARKALDRL